MLSDAFFITLMLYIFIHLAAVHFILALYLADDNSYVHIGEWWWVWCSSKRGWGLRLVEKSFTWGIWRGGEELLWLLAWLVCTTLTRTWTIGEESIYGNWYEWVMKTLGNRTSCWNMFRMNMTVFDKLHNLLVESLIKVHTEDRGFRAVFMDSWCPSVY
jgi:hypothetical protein